MREFILLLVAFIGVAFGAYFAILKSRNERLWTDRYECLLRIVDYSESLKDKVLIEKSKNRSSGEYGPETKALGVVGEVGEKARFELRGESSKVRLLFSQKDSENLVDALQDLDRSLSDLYSSNDDNIAEKVNIVWSHAESCIDESVN